MSCCLTATPHADNLGYLVRNLIEDSGEFVVILIVVASSSIEVLGTSCSEYSHDSSHEETYDNKKSTFGS